MIYGRGSWSPVGKSNGLRQYTYVSGQPLDGNERDKGTAYYAVNLGVKAIQTEINRQKLSSSPLIVDGVFGARSAQGVREAQQKLGIGADGQAGVVTCKKLWRDLVKKAADLADIDPKYLYAQMSHESSGDPAACGYFNEPDRGLTQINTAAHPDVSLEEAHDSKFNLEWAAKRFSEALTKYKSKPSLQIVCSIAQHNSPTSADNWFKTGKAPNDKIATYVEAVLGYTSEW